LSRRAAKDIESEVRRTAETLETLQHTLERKETQLVLTDTDADGRAVSRTTWQRA